MRHMKIKKDPKITSSELDFIEEIKKLTVIAMFADDDLMEMIVLKGGNAMNIIYGMADRASIDLDFSMSADFKKDELNIIESKITKTLQSTFSAAGYTVFDIRFVERPQVVRAPKDFWGGYRVNFKLIEKALHEENKDNLALMRKKARTVGIHGKKTLQIDISKFEYCEEKEKTKVGGYTVYVYTPKMIVFEKVRAICQQMPEYRAIIETMRPAPRARDFFDIYMLLNKFPFDIYEESNVNLLRAIFEIKKVPFGLLSKIDGYREYHRADFSSLQATVRPSLKLEEFDYYFDYVVERFGRVI